LPVLESGNSNQASRSKFEELDESLQNLESPRFKNPFDNFREELSTSLRKGADDHKIIYLETAPNPAQESEEHQNELARLELEIINLQRSFGALKKENDQTINSTQSYLKELQEALHEKQVLSEKLKDQDLKINALKVFILFT